MAKKKHKKKVETASFVEIEKDFGLWEDYMAFGPQYYTANDCPLIPGETECVQELPTKCGNQKGTPFCHGQPGGGILAK